MKEVQALETNDKVLKAATELRVLEQEGRLKELDLTRIRFQQGLILRDFFELDAADHYGKNVIQRISQATGIHSMMLYRSHLFAAALDYSSERLESDIAQAQQSGKRLSMNFYVNKVKALKQSPEAEAISKEIALRDVEGATESLEVLKERFGSNDPEVQGVQQLFVESLKEAVPNALCYHDPQYRQWLSGESCHICANDAYATHLVRDEDGNPASDLLALPLCADCRSNFLRKGTVAFLTEYGIGFMAVIAYVQKYLETLRQIDD